MSFTSEKQELVTLVANQMIRFRQNPNSPSHGSTPRAQNQMPSSSSYSRRDNSYQPSQSCHDQTTQSHVIRDDGIRVEPISNNVPRPHYDDGIRISPFCSTYHDQDSPTISDDYVVIDPSDVEGDEAVSCNGQSDNNTPYPSANLPSSSETPLDNNTISSDDPVENAEDDQDVTASPPPSNFDVSENSSAVSSEEMEDMDDAPNIITRESYGRSSVDEEVSAETSDEPVNPQPSAEENAETSSNISASVSVSSKYCKGYAYRM